MEKIIIRKYTEKDVHAMCGIWNEVVEDGGAFPQEEALTEKTGSDFFASQTYCAVAEETESGKIAGFTFCTRTTSAAALISQTQATL